MFKMCIQCCPDTLTLGVEAQVPSAARKIGYLEKPFQFPSFRSRQALWFEERAQFWTDLGRKLPCIYKTYPSLHSPKGFKHHCRGASSSVADSPSFRIPHFICWRDVGEVQRDEGLTKWTQARNLKVAVANGPQEHKRDSLVPEAFVPIWVPHSKLNFKLDGCSIALFLSGVACCQGERSAAPLSEWRASEALSRFLLMNGAFCPQVPEPCSGIRGNEVSHDLHCSVSVR